jgi:hypothetical protein
VKPVENCEGYKKLRAAVERDIKKRARSPEELEKHFAWVIERAKHYAEKTGLEAADILDAWERDRDYWHLNYYQEGNQPEIKGDDVRVFDTPDDFKATLDGKGFRCPACGGVSTNPVTCDSGIRNKNGKVCDWKAYGLFRTMGKGVTLFIKSDLRVYNIFKPVAWEV